MVGERAGLYLAIFVLCALGSGYKFHGRPFGDRHAGDREDHAVSDRDLLGYDVRDAFVLSCVEFGL